MYRAQGEPKEFGTEVKELKTMLDPKINPRAATIFGSVPKKVQFVGNWKLGGGSSPISLRAALAELKGEAENIRHIEGGYFIYEQGVSPDEFDRKFKEGRENAIGLIPSIIQTQRSLKERYPSGVVVVYRGLAGR